MFNPIKFFTRPEYFCRPSQAFRRLRRFWQPPQPVETVQLPWGATVRVRISENVGSDIYHYGIFDPVVPEAIWRLLDAGETAIDIGANIGQNTSVMAYRAGNQGRVLAFEPHPEILRELQHNSQNWTANHFAKIRLESVALGREAGTATLVDGPEFDTNRGSASLATENTANLRGRKFDVPVKTFDCYESELTQVGVCKIDVEGHELAVLGGASRILAQQRIRDLIFEDFNPMPSPVAQLLGKNGFTIFRMEETWLKPVLTPITTTPQQAGGFSYNYLATQQPDRAIARFRKAGWRCLLGWSAC